MKQIKTNTSKDVGEEQSLFAAGGNVNLYSNEGN